MTQDQTPPDAALPGRHDAAPTSDGAPSLIPPVPPRSRRPQRRSRGLLFAGLLGGLVVAWAGATAYMGSQARKISSDAVTTLQTSLASSNTVRVVSHTSTPGFLSSTEDVILALPPELASTDKKPARLHLRNTIKHGPLPGLSRVGQALIDTELVWDDAATRAAVDKAFGGKKPVIRTLVGLGGSTDTVIEVPAGRYSGAAGDGVATWQTLTGRFQGGQGGRALSGTLVWPGGTVGTAAEVARVGELRLVMNQTPYLKTLSTGTSTLTLASIALPGNVGALNGFKSVTTTGGSGANLQSQTVSTLDSFNLTSGGAPTKYSNLRLVMSAGNLNAEALESLAQFTATPEYRALSSGSTPTEAQARTVLDLMLPALQKLLSGNPVLKVDEISGTTPQGKLKLGLSAAVINGQQIQLKSLIDSGDTSQLMGLLGNLKLSADISGDEAVIGQLLNSSENATAQGIAASIDPMIEQGMITRSGKTLSTKLTFGAEGATINGKPMGGL